MVKGTEDAITCISYDITEEATEVIPEHLKTCCRQLEAYFKGEQVKFTCLLKPKGTAFQQEVWNALLKLPYGERSTYKKIAMHIGRPRSVRAVGNAIGRNPLLILIPCHRVIHSDGSLSGFAAGVERKVWLLNLEHGVVD